MRIRNVLLSVIGGGILAFGLYHVHSISGVTEGGAPSGDDALAMSLSQRFSIPIERVYLTTDLTVLALSLSYLPVKGIACSLLTVVLSGKIIGIIQRWGNS